MESSELRGKIMDVMCAVFTVERQDFPRNPTYGSLENWDSIGHMNLLIGLEEEFGVVFTDSEVVDLISMDLIQSILSDKLESRT
jgi:acyl carrier protein